MTQDTVLLDELAAYREFIETAWSSFDKLVEIYYIQLGSDIKQSVSDRILRDLEATAIRYQRIYFKRYYRTHECTCKPDDAIACDVCKAQIKAKSIYREEL